MKRTQIVAGLFAEYDAFIALISELTAPEWRAATRCAGWEVRDVAGHVVGNAVDTMTGVIGTRTPDEQAEAFRDRSPGALATDLRHAADRIRPFIEGLSEKDWRGSSPVAGRSLGNGVHTLWHDTFVHGDDVRAALGRPAVRGPGMVASVGWLREELERRGWGPARFALDGLGECAVGDGGPLVRADPMRFVLVATGRSDPAGLGLDESVNVHSVR